MKIPGKYLKKKYILPVSLLSAGILILIFQNKSAPTSDVSPPERCVAYVSSELESRIEKLCESVDGIRKAEVFLTMDTSEEYVYAESSEKNGEYFKSEFVKADSGNGMELYVVNPKVRGVAVVCTGGDRASVKAIIKDLVSSSLGIEKNKVSVAGS